MFFARILCMKVCSKPNSKQRKDVRTKNVLVKHWWNWHLENGVNCFQDSTFDRTKLAHAHRVDGTVTLEIIGSFRWLKIKNTENIKSLCHWNKTWHFLDWFKTFGDIVPYPPSPVVIWKFIFYKYIAYLILCSKIKLKNVMWHFGRPLPSPMCHLVTLSLSTPFPHIHLSVLLFEGLF